MEMFESLRESLSQRVEEIYDNNGGPRIISGIKFLFIQVLVLLACLPFALFFFGFLYYFAIPNMQQSLQLHFLKPRTTTGFATDSKNYLGFYFNPAQRHNLCADEAGIGSQILSFISGSNSSEIAGMSYKLRDSFEEFGMDLETICSIYMYDQENQLVFERESYQMNLRLSLLRVVVAEHTRLNPLIPIDIFIIPATGQPMKIQKVMHVKQNQPQRWLLTRIVINVFTRVLDLLGISVEGDNVYEIDEMLFQNLPNAIVNLSAILIRIQDVDLFVKDADLVINPILTGIRYYLYNWFYTTSCVIITSITFTLFLALQVGKFYFDNQTKNKFD